jgi:hypothetical protein
MFDDLALEQDTDGRPPPGPALVVSAPMADRELRIAELCHRFANVASRKLIFTTENEETGEEEWETTIITDRATGAATVRRIDAEQWQAIMSWPREPTIEEVLAFQANAIARAQVDLWRALQRGSPESDAYLASKL